MEQSKFTATPYTTYGIIIQMFVCHVNAHNYVNMYVCTCIYL